MNDVALEKVEKMALGTLLPNPKSDSLPEYILCKHYQRKHGTDAYYRKENEGDKK